MLPRAGAPSLSCSDSRGGVPDCTCVGSGAREFGGARWRGSRKTIPESRFSELTRAAEHSQTLRTPSLSRKPERPLGSGGLQRNHVSREERGIPARVRDTGEAGGQTAYTSTHWEAEGGLDCPRSPSSADLLPSFLVPRSPSKSSPQTHVLHGSQTSKIPDPRGQRSLSRRGKKGVPSLHLAP